MRVSINDHEDEDIVQHMPKCLEFIEEGRQAQGGSPGDPRPWVTCGAHALGRSEAVVLLRREPPTCGPET